VICSSINKVRSELMLYLRGLFGLFVFVTLVLQFRNFNRYRVERTRKHSEARVYLNSDVCADAITRSQLGRFNLCEKAEHIVDESPTEAAMYDIVNDWYPCGHGRCEGTLDWLWSHIHWIFLCLLVSGMMIYFKWVDYQRDRMFTRLTLPRLMRSTHRVSGPVEHVD